MIEDKIERLERHSQYQYEDIEELRVQFTRLYDRVLDLEGVVEELRKGRRD